MSGRNMHVEIQVALNFLISFLYNKLPRRRVNQFGEELEKALKEKFQGHWYPEKPYKGSAFRCLKTAPPLEPVFEVAARESGMDLGDIQENLPRELSIWVDPGEVSYRMGEKLPVKILYSDGDKDRSQHEREVARTFNPEAQCFKPIDSLSSQLAGLGLQRANYANGNVSPTECHRGSPGSSPVSPGSPGSTSPTSRVFGSDAGNHSSTPNSPTGSVTPPSGFKNAAGSTSSSNASSPGCAPASSFLGGKTPALTFTTAAFAQTKFGSTKLKTSSKRSHRMSPTEFSAYIKQRAMLQQQQQHSAAAAMFVAAAAASSAAVAASNNGVPANGNSNGRPGSLSPLDPGYLLMGPPPPTPGNASQQAQQQHHHNNNPFNGNGPSAANANRSFGVFDHGYLGDLFAAAAGSKLGASTHQQRSPTQNAQSHQQQLPSRFSPYEHQQNKALGNQMDSYVGQTVSNQTTANANAAVNAGSQPVGNANNGNNKSFPQPLVDGVTFNLNVGPYPNQYQHLLVAN